MMKIKHIIKKFVYRLRGDHTTEELEARGFTHGSNFVRMVGAIIDPAHCWLIHIGDNVTLAPRVHLLAHDASTFNWLGYTRIGRIDIGDNVFIGASSIILPNVKIGNNVIIGANSTVTSNVADDSVVVGTPAHFICKTSDYIKRNRDLMVNSPIYDKSFSILCNISHEKKAQMNRELNGKYGFIL